MPEILHTAPATEVTPTKPADREPTAWFGWGLAIFATVCFSIAAPVARGAITAGFDSTSLLTARMVLATLLLGGTIAVTAPSRLKIDSHGLRAAIVIGSINGIAMMLFFWALNSLEASLIAMILSLSPIVVLSLLALRGEKITYRHGVRLALALIGVYLLIGPGGQVHWGGVALGTLSVLLFSLQMALTQWYLIGYDTRTVVFYVTSSMTVVVVVSWLIQGAHWQEPGWAGWLAVIALAVVSTYLSRLTYFAAVSILGSGQLSLLGPLETLLSIVWAILFLDERLTPIQFVGGVFILLSTVLAIQRLGRVSPRLRWRFRPRA